MLRVVMILSTGVLTSVNGEVEKTRAYIGVGAGRQRGMYMVGMTRRKQALVNFFRVIWGSWDVSLLVH